MTYLELVFKPRYGLARDDLVQFVHLHPQVASRDVCLSTGDQLLQSIMDEHILGLGFGVRKNVCCNTCFLAIRRLRKNGQVYIVFSSHV